MIMMILKISSSLLAVTLLFGSSSEASCPYMLKGGEGANPHLFTEGQRKLFEPRSGDHGIPEGGFAAVRADLRALLTDSQEFFPADFEPPVGPNYGGLFIRLAWHCSGSYRDSDGRGGCDGGRIRFDPELNWPDNTNLNNALRLLEPIKEKYGSSLSWGDLIILSGTEAISAMGGPILGFCGGRVDDSDGSNSLILGPSPEQEELVPCQSIGLQGKCPSPLGPTTMGLIYVNPEGPVNNTGNPVASGVDVRDAFARMGFNDTETVALVGGGHAFGKCHGACTNPPCGEPPFVGIGNNTWTSGFEGAWTTLPTTWTNQYFNNLFDYEWVIGTGPGGFFQWAPNNSNVDIMMLTTDVALREDPIYEPISRNFAANIGDLEHQFKHAWYRLTTADMGPRERCINENPDDIPAAQWWQYPLPASEDETPINYIPIRSMIQDLIDTDSSNVAAFANLAYRCASTFRETDYKGGCNGARIRFPPESEWPENAGTAEALATLESVKEAHPEISYADLIVLAGNVAVESSLGVKMPFCGGRVDANDASGSEVLAPRYYGTPFLSVRDDMQVKGLADYEGVALFAIPSGLKESATATTRSSQLSTISNQYFVGLLAGTGDHDDYELALLEGEFSTIVNEYAADEAKFKQWFVVAWEKMMTADRFDGPVGNVCSQRSDPTTEDVEAKTTEPTSSAPVIKALAATRGVMFFVAAAFAFVAFN